jgi:hypothetical protein
MKNLDDDDSIMIPDGVPVTRKLKNTGSSETNSSSTKSELFLDENKIFLEISFSYQKFSDQKCGVFLCFM